MLYLHNNELVSRISKELPQLINNKKEQLFFEESKNLEHTFQLKQT